MLENGIEDKQTIFDMEKKRKRAQAWGIDLAVALIIFTVGILIFFFYTVNRPAEARENLDYMFYDGNLIADSLMSEGSPLDWDSSNVVTVGILSENKINETKLEQFYNLSIQDYSRTKQLFNTRFDYYFFLSGNMSLYVGEVEGIGYSPLNENNLVKITRFTIYKDKPTTAYFYIWE